MEENKPLTRAYTKPNGPLIVTGEFEFENEEGEITIEKRVAFCRCANSSKMPYCDGSHSRVGFQSK